MIKHLYILYFFLFITNTNWAQTLVATAEAESGVLVGVNTAPQTGNSSGPYVTGFNAAGDKVTVTVNLPKAAIYRVVVTYRANAGAKVQDFYANNNLIASINFPLATTFVNIDAAKIFLNGGSNTFAIQNNWGYMDVDKFSVYTIPPNVYTITPNLIDTLATNSTKCLYTYLASQFNNKIISGQTTDYYDQVKTTTSKSPLLRAYDLYRYSPQYPYAWQNGGFAFAPVPDMSPENAIAWYYSTNKKGIVTFHWHWPSPSGGTAGTNTFYSNSTTFDVSKAVINGTQENIDVLRDIDSIAVQLKKLRDADVPVLWRPLHEAGGAWFWWGAKGSAACKSLYDIMYNRLSNYHGLHNLIWVWSTPEASWYPGNAKVDMIGYDSYPGAFNYTEQKTIFDQLHTIVSGQKLIALTENGPIPDIQRCFDADAPWAYFMSWNELTFSENTNQHIIDMFAHTKVVTLENQTNTCSIYPAPVVEIITPVNNSTICKEAVNTITANVSIYSGSINKVDFYDGATLLATDSTTPYSYVWTTPTTGTHTVKAIATSAQNIVSNTAKSIVTVNVVPASVVPALAATSTKILVAENCTKANWLFYKDPSNANSVLVAVYPNGNTWAPNSITATTDASDYQVVNGASTSRLMKRYVTIDAPGTYTVNGGVKIRFYYSTTEKTATENTMTMGSKWFKHPGNVAATKADIAPYSFNNAITLIPAATGVDQGINYVDFEGIQSFSTFGLTASNAFALPLQLVSFIGKQQNCQAKLTWKTLMEQNTERFEIERSLDGGQSWEKAGTVSAAGNTISDKIYNYETPMEKNKINQFRLKMMDKHDLHTYSNIILIKCQQLELVTIKPNPTNSIINIQGAKPNTLLQLFSMNGKLLYTQKLASTVEVINVEKYLQGTYLVRLMDAITGKTTNIKLIKY